MPRAAQSTLLVCALLLWGAATLAATHSPRLTREQVVRIAKRAAKDHGYKLDEYRPRKVHFEFTRNDFTWTLFFEGKVLYPGHHFQVWVHDRTQKAVVMPGQ